MIEKYFNEDIDIQKLTNGKYNCISLYRKELFLSVTDPQTFKIKRYEKIGYVIPLSIEQNYAGASFLDVDDIIFEEFMSRDVYLSDEPNKLMNLYATVDRKRLTTRLWLVGNTISRVCPYLEEWGLQKMIAKQKQDSILIKEIADIDEKNPPIKIALEYCLNTGNTSGTIGTNAKMINSGAWETKPQPHLPKSYSEYKTIYRFGFQYQSFRFLAEYLVDSNKSTPIWFIKPYNKEFDKNIIVISDEIKVSIFWQRDVYNLSIPNENLKKLFLTFKENNIFYADDMTGTDFKQVIDFSIRR